jgi:PTH1 family peptidyl-tRNA hydrolase
VKLIFCLGNPGIEYRKSRHNIGFMIADALTSSKVLLRIGSKFKSDFTVIDLEQECLIIKPRTFMNNSGASVIKFYRKYYPLIDDILVIHDDLDIPKFSMRFKVGGSSGGHHGVQSIIDYLGRDDFARLRVGIGRPPGGKDPIEFVLEHFRSDELDELGEVINSAVLAVEFWAKEGIQSAMNRFNCVKDD